MAAAQKRTQSSQQKRAKGEMKVIITLVMRWDRVLLRHQGQSKARRLKLGYWKRTLRTRMSTLLPRLRSAALEAERRRFCLPSLPPALRAVVSRCAQPTYRWLPSLVLGSNLPPQENLPIGEVARV